MNYDLLLSWVSERGHGSLTSFRKAHDWLAADAQPTEHHWTWALQSLQSLGHIEVSWQRRRWETAPTTIATAVNGGGYAFLCGARTQWLLRRIESLESDPELSHLAQSIVLERPIAQSAGPELQLLTLDSDHDIEILCTALTVRFAPYAADRLLAFLPPLSAILRVGRRDELPGGVFPSRMGDSRPGSPLFNEVILIADFCTNFGWRPETASQVPAASAGYPGGPGMLVCHPLERRRTPRSPRLETSALALHNQGSGAQRRTFEVETTYDLVRRPGVVWSRLATYL